MLIFPYFHILMKFQLYLSVNSGARIGLAEEVKASFRIAWEDSNAPDRGFRYLYLTAEDYSRLAPLGSIRAVLIEDEGEARYKITDIIGIVYRPDNRGTVQKIM